METTRRGDERPLMRAEEVARLAGVSTRHILELAKRGAIPSVRLGRCVRIRPEVADDLLKDNRAQAA